MSYTLASPHVGRQSSLLLIVIALHAAVLLLLLAARHLPIQIAEMPMIIDFLPSETTQTEVKPQAVNKAVTQRPVSPISAKTKPTPIEASNTQLPSADAPQASLPENKPAAATAPALPSETISQARFDADYLKNPAPAYPPLARRMGEEGKVILRVSVNPQGTADSVDIKTSSGITRLDEAAQKTVRNWKFVPAKRGDSAVQSWVLVPIIFKLEQ